MQGTVARKSDTAAPAGDEAAWISASQQGDETAFNRLVLRWEGTVFNLALRMLQDHDEAAEVSQDVFLSAFRSIGRFRRRSRFSTWLYRIAANKCLTRLERSPRRRQVPLEADDSPVLGRKLSLVESQDRLVWERERRQGILEALAELPAEQRVVVEMRIYQDLKFGEIAEQLDLHPSTVKSRFYTALGALKDRLAPLR